MEEKFHVSSSPHIRSRVTTGTIMSDVAIALIPASVMGIYQFGFKAFLILLVSITACVVSEFVYERLMKKQRGPYECSALVTGLLLGMNLPSTAPVWMPAVGGIFAIIVVKQLYGGLGLNFMNPALAARCFLSICYAKRMADYAINSFAGSGAKNEALYLFNHGAAGLDGITGATPLAVVKAGGDVSLSDMFWGFTGGVIGETSVIMLLIGAGYLVYRKVISLRIPLTYIGTFAVFILLFGGQGSDLKFLAEHLCGGGLMLGAFFMATDYVTSPITVKGQIVFGVILGILTGLFRIFGNNAEGVSYAIIFCNLLVPLIEKCTMPKAFGRGGKHYGRR